MAVVSISEHWVGRGGDAVKEGTIFHRSWKIRTDDKWDNEVTIKASPLGVANLPNYLDPHPSNFFATCRKLTIKQQADSPFSWKADAEYSTKPVETENPESEPNPLARPAIIRWNSAQYEKYRDVDQDGKAKVNPCGDCFEEVPNVDDARWVVSVSKNIAPPLPTWLLAANNRINESEFVVGGLTVAAALTKLQGIAISEEKEENSVKFHELFFELHFREEGWLTKLGNFGFEYYEPPRDIKAKLKNPVRLATTGSGSLATSFQAGETLDGKTLAENNEILIKNQAAPIENGYYVVQASGAPTRRSDMATDVSANGFITYVKEGDANAKTWWECTSLSGSDVVDTDAITFATYTPVVSASPTRKKFMVRGKEASDPKQLYPNGWPIEHATVNSATWSEFRDYANLDFTLLPLT